MKPVLTSSDCQSQRVQANVKKKKKSCKFSLITSPVRLKKKKHLLSWWMSAVNFIHKIGAKKTNS